MAMGKRHVERRAQTHEHGAGHRLHGPRRLALGKGWKNYDEGRSGLETCEGATALDDFVAGRKPDLRPSTHAEQVWHLPNDRRYALRALDDLSRPDEDEVRHRYSYSGDGEPQELMATQAGTTTVPALLGVPVIELLQALTDGHKEVCAHGLLVRRSERRQYRDNRPPPQRPSAIVPYPECHHSGSVNPLPRHGGQSCSVWPANHRAVVRQNACSHYRRLHAREPPSGHQRTRLELCDHRRNTRSAGAARCLYKSRRSQNPCCRPLPPCVTRTRRPRANPPWPSWCASHPTQHSTA